MASPALSPAVRVPFAALLLALSAAASAQPATPPPPPPVGGDSTVSVGVPTDARVGRDAYAAAVSMLGSGQVTQAIPLLERLAAETPGSLPVEIKLQEAYERAGRVDEALLLVQRRLGTGTAASLVERGSVLMRADRPDEATAAFTSALDLGPADEQTLRGIADALTAARRYADAAAVLERGREAMGSPDAFRFERAALYAQAQDVGRAADLYLDALAERPESGRAVQARFRRMLDAAGAPEALRAAVDRAQTRDPLNRAYRELASFLALERGDYDAALDGIRALDRLDRENGQSLLAFAATAEAAGALDAAARALDEILTRHADGPVAPDARVARAALLERRSRATAERTPNPTPFADAARTDLTAFREREAGHPAAPRAALTLARLTRDVYLDYAASEALLNEAADGPDAVVAAEARLDLGDIAVRAGRLDEARERFQAVDEAMGTGRLAEQARFELALVNFYEGYVFSALARVEAIDENTAADATNDAIALRVTLNENAGDPSSADSTNATLKAYAAASLLVRQGRDATALASLDSLHTVVGDGPLADEILFLSAVAQRRLGRHTDAVATLDRLAADVPLSFFCDRALVLQADIAEQDLADRTAAMQRLALLLERYPGSLFAPDARERLRAMRAAS